MEFQQSNVSLDNLNILRLMEREALRTSLRKSRLFWAKYCILLLCSTLLIHIIAVYEIKSFHYIMIINNILHDSKDVVEEVEVVDDDDDEVLEHDDAVQQRYRVHLVEYVDDGEHGDGDGDDHDVYEQDAFHIH